MSSTKSGRATSGKTPKPRKRANPVGRGAPAAGPEPPPAPRKSSVAKVSHTLSVALAERLEAFAFFQRISESAVIEHSLAQFFAQSDDDDVLGEELRSYGAGRRRRG